MASVSVRCSPSSREGDSKNDLVETIVTPMALSGRTFGEVVRRVIAEVTLHIREGRIQRWLALIAGLSSGVSALEVGYLHYRGSYSRRVMYTPVILSAALFVAGVAAFRSRRVAKTVLPIVSGVTLVDCAIGLYFHAKGVQRRPGGWRLPLTNIVMGPPILAPLLLGTSAYLGLLASFSKREDEPAEIQLRPAASAVVAHRNSGRERATFTQNVSEGRIQGPMALTTAIAAAATGFEAFYSHYQTDFRHKAQWMPIVVAPLLALSGLAAAKSSGVAKTALPATSWAAVIVGVLGFGFHARGMVRRSQQIAQPTHNLLYGPPPAAPLLLAAAGAMGLLATLMRRPVR